MANTGKKIVLTLKRIQNPGAIDTGDRKNNVMSDPDYIAPYTDLGACPVSYSIACPVVKYTREPTTLEYEFTLPNSVVNNPIIKKVKVNLSAGGFTTTFVLPNTPSANYFRGNFTGLTPATTYTIQVQYLDAVDAAIVSCPIP